MLRSGFAILWPQHVAATLNPVHSLRSTFCCLRWTILSNIHPLFALVLVLELTFAMLTTTALSVLALSTAVLGAWPQAFDSSWLSWSEVLAATTLKLANKLQDGRLVRTDEGSFKVKNSSHSAGVVVGEWLYIDGGEYYNVDANNYVNSVPCKFSLPNISRIFPNGAFEFYRERDTLIRPFAIMVDWQRRAHNQHETLEHDAGPAAIDVVRWTSQCGILDQRLGLPKY
jgi:hypothetical protein